MGSCLCWQYVSAREKGEYLSEILKEKEKMSEDFFRSGYVILCGFSALGLMPFLWKM